MISQAEENYLKVLRLLSDVNGVASVNEIGKELNIKMPTVNSMMKKLSEKGLVFYESYKPIKLTPKGKKEAALIIRKHRLTEMYLVEKMGFGWEQVHSIAEQIEHIQSPEFFAKMDELLGYPKIDPHGSPIPDINGKMEWKEYKKLSECKEGETIKVAAVINSSDEFLRFLNGREIHLGLKIKIKSVEPFDKSMVVSYDKRSPETLSHTVCERLLVEIL
ncbi:metal-dependent transcriptional regulator [Proteiniphilum acetatigenes]|uniref:metal-dependent transcriptional regulator n=1 Tax=Proteiniphilum acetatigenes TaxID=294710 RepID=UPI000370FC94|nr:metal-dependent transcriptional regulator [Proteiniphilum acetatigenes]SFK31757.1 iron (metal) dependent repressor, DtxR family [Porphyromonadaceae bacterium KH3CP3RA]